jgi:hypothetical protein
MPTGKPEEPETDAGNRDDDVPPWFAQLPPEIRDALAGGAYERIPAKYRPLIQRYFLWLQKNRR